MLTPVDAITDQGQRERHHLGRRAAAGAPGAT